MMPVAPSFLDERLRGSRTEIRGRRYAGVPYLQVSTFQVEREGRFQTPEYYCSICAISVRSPQICPCCQGPMELRMKPDRPVTVSGLDRGIDSRRCLRGYGSIPQVS